MDYLLKSAGIITLFFLVYKIFLTRETFFQTVRIYFLVGIICAVVIPFINITTYVESTTTPILVYSQTAKALLNSPMNTEINWTYWLTIIYVIGVVLSGIYLVFQFKNLYKILINQPYKKIENHKIIESDIDVSPFSFFNYIVYNPIQFSESERRQLLNHEQTHAKQWHSFDTVLIQLFICVQWFNPFIWLYKNAMTQNLEYLADSFAKHTVTPKNYAYLLLKTTSPNYQMALVNNFYNSLLKKRIMMLHKNNSRRINQLKLALILPLLIGFIFAFNTKVVAQHKVENTKIDVTVFAMILDKDFTPEDVANIKSTFKNDYGFQIKIKNVKRNTKNEITGIKIIASKGNSSSEYAVKGDKPIAPIRFMYNSKDNQLNISAITEKHFGKKYSFTYEFKNDKNSKIHKLKKISKDGDGENVEIFVVSDNNSLHKIKSTKKGDFIFISDNDKGRHQTIVKNGNYNEVWKDKDGTITRVFEVKTDKNGNVSKTIKVKADGKGENIFIKEIHHDDDDLFNFDANESKNKFIYKTNNDSKPMIVIDGKEMKEGNIDKIDPKNIKSVNVLKGEKAIKKYGQKAENGVVEITTKSKE